MDTFLDTIKIELDKEQNASKVSSLFSNVFYYEKILILVIFILLILLTFSSIFNSYFIFKNMSRFNQVPPPIA